jgi:hypothetical protein
MTVNMTRTGMSFALWRQQSPCPEGIFLECVLRVKDIMPNEERDPSYSLVLLVCIQSVQRF